MQFDVHFIARSSNAVSTGRLNSGSLQSFEDIARGRTRRLVFGTNRELRAIGVICRSLVINAWRKRRDEVSELKIRLANEQHLRLQIEVLKDFLKKENLRVTKLEDDLHWSKAHSEELVKERDRLKMVRMN